MTAHSRRGLLAATTSLVAIGAGCLSEDEGNPADGEPASPGSPDDGDDDPDGSEDDENESLEVGDGLEAADVVRFEHPDYPDEPRIELLLSAEDATDWIADHEHLDEESPVAEALDELDFEESTAVAIEAGAPDLCHRLAVDSVAIEDAELSIRAAVREDEDAGDICGQQVTAVGALVSATATDDPPTAASLSITTADGSSHAIGVAVETDEEGTSGSDGTDGGE